MKAIRFLVMFAVIMAVVGLAVQPAAAQTKWATYVTGTQVMNVGSATANITITYYDAAGNVVGSTPAGTTIDSFQSATFTPAGTGSAVISSDQPLAAVTNLQNASGGAFVAGGAYVGASAGATSVSLPLLAKNPIPTKASSWISVQNAGSSDATVNVDYSDCGAAIDATAVVKPAASATFQQAGEACHTATVFSGQITATQPVVAVVVYETSVKISAYSGFATSATNPVLPLINQNNNFNITGVQIQNTGAASTDVTLSYTPGGAGTACTETQTIAAGSSKTFTLTAFGPVGLGGPYTNDPVKGTTTCLAGQTFVGSARVTGNTGTMPLVAVVNQSKSLQAEAYGAFDAANATGTLVLPLIQDRNGSNVWVTGISIQNVGAAATFIKCDFAGTLPGTPSRTPYSFSQNSGTTAIAQYATMVKSQKDVSTTAGFVGSATCKGYTSNAFTTVDTNAKLVGIVNEVGQKVPAADRFLVYEGISIP